MAWNCSWEHGGRQREACIIIKSRAITRPMEMQLLSADVTHCLHEHAAQPEIDAEKSLKNKKTFCNQPLGTLYVFDRIINKLCVIGPNTSHANTCCTRKKQ